MLLFFFVFSSSFYINIFAVCAWPLSAFASSSARTRTPTTMHSGMWCASSASVCRSPTAAPIRSPCTVWVVLSASTLTGKMVLDGVEKSAVCVWMRKYVTKSNGANDDKPPQLHPFISPRNDNDARVEKLNACIANLFHHSSEWGWGIGKATVRYVSISNLLLLAAHVHNITSSRCRLCAWVVAHMRFQGHTHTDRNKNSRHTPPHSTYAYTF